MTHDGGSHEGTSDASSIADELYSLNPAEFIGARARHIKDAKRAGNKDLAAEIGQLRKPTVVAWAVNQASRALEADLTAMLRLGDALREAQRRLSGAQLHTLTGQRQQVVSALAHKIGDHAADNGHPLSEASIREVAQTLNAALADPDITEKVRAGRLVAAATYSGFGPTGLTSVPQPSQSAGLSQSAESESPDRAQARAELTAARENLERVQSESTAASEAAAKARHRIGEIDKRIAALREELDHAEQERNFARSAERAATDAQHTTDRELVAAQQRLSKAESALRR